MKRYFYQDFLFENMPVDRQEYPQLDEYDYRWDGQNCEVEISLDRLLRMNNVGEWNNLRTKISGKSVLVRDDTLIQNEEMSCYKSFYLKTYIHEISKYAKDCFVML